MLVQAGDQILVLAEDDDSYTCNERRYSVDLLYWYKSTHTDADKRAGSVPPPRVGELPNALKAERLDILVPVCEVKLLFVDQLLAHVQTRPVRKGEAVLLCSWRRDLTYADVC